MPRYPRRSLDAVLEAAVLVLVLAGLPIGLWLLSGNPIPSHLPGRLDVQMWWSGVQLHPASALNILPGVAVDALWIAWAWYAAWTALGLLWELLHLPAVLMPRILLHLTPRTTVQAITAGAVAAAPAVHAAPALVHTTAGAHQLPADLTGRLHLTAIGEQHPKTLRPGFPLSVLNHPALQDARVHEVVEGDTLWDLAVHYYGDGERWRRIFNGNILRPQPDGNRLTNPDLILPGWKLIIPHRDNPARPAATAPVPTAPLRPAATPNGAPTAPGTARTPARSAPNRSHAPAPGRNGHSVPAADPRTVGWHIPEGGYIGITLIAAIAASTALLATRKRLHPDTTPPIPDSAQQLTALHDTAKRTRTPARAAIDYQGQLPPLFKPQPGIPMLGTYPRGTEEAWYDPGLKTGPLVITGPGAEDTVRALALSMLGASDLDLDLEPGTSPIGWEMVLTDQALARDLFGATPRHHLPGWLELTDTPQAAVAAFHAAARRRAALDIDPQDFIPGDDEPLTVLITRTDPALHDTVIEACRTDPTASLGAILLGDAPTAEHTTTLTIDQNHSTTSATGPRARELQHLHLYHATRTLAEELFGVLYTAREVYRQPPTTPDPTPENLTRGPADDTVTAAATPPVARDDTQAPVEESPSDPEHATTVPASADDPRALISTPLLLRVLGPVDILGPDTTRPARGERTRAILTLLALHPAGLRATQLLDLAWNQPPRSERAQKNALYEAQNRIRTLLDSLTAAPAADTGQKADSPVLFDAATGRYQLNPDHITTDLRLRAHLEDQADHTDDPQTRLRLLAQAAALHRGALADGLDDNERDWLTIARYQALLDAARLHLRVADLAADTDPGTALDHVKRAAALADDEHTVTETIRLFEQLGRDDLARALDRRRPG